MKYNYKFVGKNGDSPVSKEFNTPYEAIGEIENVYQRAQYIKTVEQAVNEVEHYGISTVFVTPDGQFIVYAVYEYVITGENRMGARFKIETTSPWNYNIWKGTLWRIEKNGKRKKVRSLSMEAATIKGVR